jgi:hypothetical protein
LTAHVDQKAFPEGSGQRARPPKYGHTSSPFRPGDWTCPSCTAHVFASRSACFKCGDSRPDGDEGEAGAYDGARKAFPEEMSGRRGRPGDWTCPSCTAHVFASKSACFKCGAEKPGI